MFSFETDGLSQALTQDDHPRPRKSQTPHLSSPLRGFHVGCLNFRIPGMSASPLSRYVERKFHGYSVFPRTPDWIRRTTPRGGFSQLVRL